MTLVLAIKAMDGLVLASDGQMTFATTGQPVKAETQKLNVSWSNVVWGGSGNVGVIQRVAQALESKHRKNIFERKSIADVRKEITKTVSKTVKDIVDQQYQQVSNHPGWEGSYLFAGWVPEGPLIFAIEQNLLEMDHSTVGYVAIGSGDVFAYASLAHYEVRKRRLQEAKLIGYRVLQDAIGTAAFGLGEPIQMVEIADPNASTHGSASVVDEVDLLAIRDKVEEWRLSEAEVLTDLVGIPPPATQNDNGNGSSSDD